jgi:hypothetical protein
VNLLTGNYSQPEDFLKRFSRYNFQGFCLGALFTTREFQDLVLGKSTVFTMREFEELVIG